MRYLDASKLILQLRYLGVEEGDTLFISGNLMNVGLFKGSREKNYRTWVELLLTVVGARGTIVLPAYSKLEYRWSMKDKFVYTKDSISESGSLVNAFIKYAPDFERSTHPATSCVAVGPLASQIVSDHSPDAPSYLPYQKIIKLGGKNLMLGTLDAKNAPMAFHAAQEVLGHTKTHPLNNMLCNKYIKDGRLERFILRDIGGCTRGIHKHWSKILSHCSSARVSFVGRSLSAIIDTRESFDFFKMLLSEAPYSIKCGDRLCISCYGRKVYNRNYSLYYLWRISHIFQRAVLFRK